MIAKIYYGNCTRLLKMKNKLKIVFFLTLTKAGRILDILRVFLMKQLFHSALLDMR